MIVGMLWFDNSPRSLEVRVNGAADYYRRKYGVQPNLCYIHPDTAGEIPERVGEVELRTSPSTLPGHFWIGVERAPKVGQLRMQL